MEPPHPQQEDQWKLDQWSEIFPGRLVFLSGGIQWPPRSPNLNSFFLWGYLETEVYKNRPGTIEGLKDAIRLKNAQIPLGMTSSYGKLQKSTPIVYSE